MTVYAVDVSGWQGPASGQDWHAVKASGTSVAIVKATEGAGYTNHLFPGVVRAARDAGLTVGAYHYLNGTGNAREQASAFLAAVAPVIDQHDLPLWLDFEEKTDHATLNGIAAVLEGKGWRVGIYTYPAWWTDRGHSSCADCGRRPLWFADYNRAHDRPAPRPWSQVAIRQTHGTAKRIPGLPGLQDWSRLEVPLATLTAGPLPPAPTPVSAPAVDVTTGAEPMLMVLHVEGSGDLWVSDRLLWRWHVGPSWLAMARAAGVASLGVTTITPGQLASIPLRKDVP